MQLKTAGSSRVWETWRRKLENPTSIF
jgi:hypothetical protein